MNGETKVGITSEVAMATAPVVPLVRPPLVAFMVYPGESPRNGCLLVYAENRNQARQFAATKGPFMEDYIEMRARRVPSFDQYSHGTGLPFCFETNDDLPPGAPEFYDDQV